MLIPLGTDRPPRRPILMTYLLIALNTAVFSGMLLAERFSPDLFVRLHFALWIERGSLSLWSPVTYAFMHGGMLHLLGNMVALWVFGPAIEDRMGRWRFLAFYLLGGVAAGLAHVASSPVPCVGASGAVAAVTGAFLVMMPRANIRCLLFFILIGIFWIPAPWFIGFSIAKDLFWLAASSTTIGGMRLADGVARAAHLGGYGFGAAVAWVLLWRGWVEREAFDLLSMARQARRRRAFAEAARQREQIEKRSSVREGKGERSGRSSSADARSMSEGDTLRAGVIERLRGDDLPGAARAYRDLADRLGPDHPAVVLGRRDHLDLANFLFREEDHASAAFAYERFLSAYGRDAEAPRVALMLALINIRYLNDPTRARALLTSASDRLTTPDERALAQELLEELG